MKTVRLAALCASMLLAACGGGSGQEVSPARQLGNGPAPSAETAPMTSMPESEQAAVVFIGDSITAFWESIPGRNAGVPTQTTAQMLDRFEADVLAYSPNVVAILGGSNDVLFTANPNTANIARMAELAASSGACVILGTVPPIYEVYYGVHPNAESTIAPIEQLNSEIKLLASAYGYEVADFHAVLSGKPELFYDGLHPTAEGYDAMRGVVQPPIDNCMER